MEAVATQPKARRPRVVTPQPLQAVQIDDALLKLQTVSTITGLSKATIYRKCAAGDFPQPVRLSARCTRFQARSVRDWLAAQQPA